MKIKSYYWKIEYEFDFFFVAVSWYKNKRVVIGLIQTRELNMFQRDKGGTTFLEQMFPKTQTASDGRPPKLIFSSRDIFVNYFVNYKDWFTWGFEIQSGIFFFFLPVSFVRWKVRILFFPSFCASQLIRIWGLDSPPPPPPNPVFFFGWHANSSLNSPIVSIQCLNVGKAGRRLRLGERDGFITQHARIVSSNIWSLGIDSDMEDWPLQ